MYESYWMNIMCCSKKTQSSEIYVRYVLCRISSITIKIGEKNTLVTIFQFLAPTCIYGKRIATCHVCEKQHNLSHRIRIKVSASRFVVSEDDSVCVQIRTYHMAFPSRVSGETSISMVFLLTFLIARISDGDCVGNINEASDEERSIDVVTTEDVFFEIVYPPELEYTYRIRPAQDFGAPFNASFSERRIALVPVEPQTGCRRPDNSDELAGKIALVWRGDCSFFLKTAIAEDAGAKAIIVADYLPNSIDDERESPLWMDHHYIEMASDNDIAQTRTINIPAGFLLGKNGRMIKETLRRLNLQFALINIPVNLTFAPLEDFHHPPWLVL